MEYGRITRLWEKLDCIRGRAALVESLHAGGDAEAGEWMRALYAEARQLSAEVRALEDERLERLIGCS